MLRAMSRLVVLVSLCVCACGPVEPVEGTAGGGAGSGGGGAAGGDVAGGVAGGLLANRETIQMVQSNPPVPTGVTIYMPSF